ncbi:hypothetical protein CR513_58589, partial [Mucuna pruriens]
MWVNQITFDKENLVEHPSTSKEEMKRLQALLALPQSIWILDSRATYHMTLFPIKHMLSFFANSHLMLSLPSRVFGCVAFVHSYNPHRGKLDPRVIKCVFIGYPSNKKWFKCYHPSSYQIFIPMDVAFNETQSFFEESYLEVELVIKSLPFHTQDVIKSLAVPT